GGVREAADRLHLFVRGGERGDDLLGFGGVRLGHIAERVLRLAAAERLGDDQHGLSVCHRVDYGTDQNQVERGPANRPQDRAAAQYPRGIITGSDATMNDAASLLTLQFLTWVADRPRTRADVLEDRKSTRLNSSH